jgi:hypothetical protein
MTPAPKIVTERFYAIHAVGDLPIRMPAGCAKEGAMRHASEHSCEIGRPVAVWTVDNEGHLGEKLAVVDSTRPTFPHVGAHCPTCRC